MTCHIPNSTQRQSPFGSGTQTSTSPRSKADRVGSGTHLLVPDPFLDAAIDEAGLVWRKVASQSVRCWYSTGRSWDVATTAGVQKGSLILHGEMDALENAGRLVASEYRRSAIYTTLSPCPMCTGAILLYGIPRVVIGENRTFLGAEELLRANGVEVIVADDQRCIDMMNGFIQARPVGSERGHWRDLAVRVAPKFAVRRASRSCGIESGSDRRVGLAGRRSASKIHSQAAALAADVKARNDRSRFDLIIRIHLLRATTERNRCDRNRSETSRSERNPRISLAYLPFHSGSRFSRNACNPSRASSVPRATD